MICDHQELYYLKNRVCCLSLNLVDQMFQPVGKGISFDLRFLVLRMFMIPEDYGAIDLIRFLGVQAIVVSKTII